MKNYKIAKVFCVVIMMGFLLTSFGYSADVKVNFQPSASPVPAGYLKDSGLVYGDRGNGYSYGWNAVTNETRDRGVNSDQRYDTLNHMNKASSPNRVWEIGLANGSYSVMLVCGDALSADNLNSVNIEGTVINDPDGLDNFDTYNVNVTVNDSRLTIKMPTGSTDVTKLCFIDITPGAWIVNGNNATTTHNVGIGTPSPGTKLHVVDTVAGEAGIRISNREYTTPNAKSIIDFNLCRSNDCANWSAAKIIAGKQQFWVDAAGNQDGYLSFEVLENEQLNEKLRLTANGKLGIGTSSPASKLHLVDNIANETGITITNQETLTGNAKGAIDFKFLRHNASGELIGAKIIAGKQQKWIDSAGNQDGYLSFEILEAEQLNEKLRIKANGSVGIGTTITGSHKLAVEGSIVAREVVVTAGSFADYVFDEDYELKSLTDVEQYIKINKHLPGVPSAQEVKDNGLPVSDMIVTQMEKIEELTLYMIEMKKENTRLMAEKSEMEERMAALEKKVEELVQE
ncbi:MAG: hypothetical protein C0403_03320 [Desulfobacterium sp.]|nr:hypothetical protein [Desulfobacterium sp.]